MRYRFVIATAVVVVTAGGIALAANNNDPHSSASTPPGSVHKPVIEWKTPDAMTKQTVPDQSNSQTSNNSTVTVNGETTTLEGDGSIDKSYTSADGQTDVSISIEHSSNSTSSHSSSSVQSHSSVTHGRSE